VGKSVQVVTDNTSKIYITGADPIGQIKSIIGYKHGDNVILENYNNVLFFNQEAVVGLNYDPTTNTYLSVTKPNDWADPLKGGWVEQCSTNKQRKFYVDAADIRLNARNYPEGGDVVDLSTGNILSLTAAGAPFTDNGTTVIIPNYKLFGVACAFVKVGEIGGSAITSLPTSQITRSATPTLSSTNQEATNLELDVKATTEILEFASSDELSEITASGTVAKFEKQMLLAGTLDTASIVATLNTAPTGGNFIIDIKKNGVSIFSTLLSIDATEKTSRTAATPYVLSGGALNWVVGESLAVFVTQVGVTIKGAGLKIGLTYKRA